MDRTRQDRTRGLTGSNSAAMKCKNTLSGQEAWRSTEWTATIDPRRYSESRVIATLINDGSHDVKASRCKVFAGQSSSLRHSGASVPNKLFNLRLLRAEKDDRRR
ncbi:Uncharacterized protein Fot_07724 [Forsythia ovata]|uniref:Uncharacterized protein n=1 Tax=Forsythia ovata TaxID=205694 RepID=A0ABD1X0R4_9LAMI